MLQHSNIATTAQLCSARAQISAVCTEPIIVSTYYNQEIQDKMHKRIKV